MSCPGLFVTGTDTEVGKTYVTALIAHSLRKEGVRVGAYKPVCSGGETGLDGRLVWPDIETLAEAIDGRDATERICPQRFVAPLAPPVAARLEDRSIDADLLRRGRDWWNDRADFLLVEGVGGLLCPLTEEETVADLAADLGYPLIVVARLGLGTINHTLLTVEVAQSRGLKVAGIVLNEIVPNPEDRATQTNPREIARRCSVPVLGVLLNGGADGLLQNGRPITIDWIDLARST